MMVNSLEMSDCNLARLVNNVVKLVNKLCSSDCMKDLSVNKKGLLKFLAYNLGLKANMREKLMVNSAGSMATFHLVSLVILDLVTS